MNTQKSFFTTLISTLLCISLSAILFACASTPNSRIKEKEKEFVAFPPEVQAQIQNGNIDKGFTEEQVYMAKGAPDEKVSTQKAGRTTTIWKYGTSKPVIVEPGKGSAPTGFAGAYGHPGIGGSGAPAQPAAMFYSKPGFSVEFENGKVKSWKE